MPKILFLPQEKAVEVAPNTTVLEAARHAGLFINSSCGGKQKCGKCAVLLKQGQDSLSPPRPEESRLLQKTDLKSNYRLACAIQCVDGLVVEIPEKGLARQKILVNAKGWGRAKISKPILEVFNLTIKSASLSNPTDDLGRLLGALKEQHDLKGLHADHHLLRELPAVLRKGAGEVGAVIRLRKELIQVVPHGSSTLLGAALDLGTTTVVCYLADLSTGKTLSTASAVNPQIRYGEDVVTRISYCSEKETSLHQLSAEAVGCINQLIKRATDEIGASPGDVLEITVVGNTAMHHLFLGLDPRYLALAPYTPVVCEPQDIKARELGIDIASSAYVHLPPVRAGFLGSDAISGVLASGIYRSKKPGLLIDLGTNGELVLGNKERMMGCSTAAGPAFEGGHIKWGMRAADGAIERVRIDPKSHKVGVKTIGGRKPVGICGSGLISAVAELLRTGLLLSKGNFSGHSTHPCLREGRDGHEFVLSPATENAVGQDIVITQKDISELQVAKAAVWAGAKVLMNKTGFWPERIYLAGAGGTSLDPEDATTIGLFPHGNHSKICPLGNAAGQGALMILVDKSYRKRAVKISEKMDYFELSGSELFQEFFVQGMFFPKARDYSESF